jgi:hypothetical protein
MHGGTGVKIVLAENPTSPVDHSGLRVSRSFGSLPYRVRRLKEEHPCPVPEFPAPGL